VPEYPKSENRSRISQELPSASPLGKASRRYIQRDSVCGPNRQRHAVGKVKIDRSVQAMKARRRYDGRCRRRGRPIDLGWPTGEPQVHAYPMSINGDPATVPADEKRRLQDKPCAMRILKSLFPYVFCKRSDIFKEAVNLS